MLRRITAYMAWRPLAAIGALAAALAVPGLAWATSHAGGGGGSGGSGLGPGGQGQTQSGNAVVSASANGITISTHTSGFMGRQMTFTGTASSSDAGQVVEIQRYGHATKNQ